MHRGAEYIEESPLLIPGSMVTEESARKLGKFVKAAMIHSTEGVQSKPDLSRTKLAKRNAKQRLATKNYQLHMGVVLTVQESWNMVQKKAENEEILAQQVLDAILTRHQKPAQRTFKKAAKWARKWRIEGQLPLAEVTMLTWTKPFRQF
ncbi:hypothetical protein GGS21DRAFT_492774 [Xylaria nigripes]|nr:hypothetical protein GGS21DRAFT_492774 [Xylaria nigripes]